MIVNLKPPDIKRCREVALKRTTERAKAQAKPIDQLDLRFQYIGVLGEYAVCTAYDCDWIGEYFEDSTWGKRTWDTAIGEVRATVRPYEEGGMRLYPDDDQLDAPYIWVTIQELGTQHVKATIVGWSTHDDGRRDKWWHSNEGYWVVPKNHLKPMDNLLTKEQKMSSIVSSGDRVVTKRESLSRCDYKVFYKGQEYYVWGMKNDTIFMHYLNTSIVPPDKEQNLVLRFLSEQKSGNRYYDSCFE